VKDVSTGCLLEIDVSKGSVCGGERKRNMEKKCLEGRVFQELKSFGGRESTHWVSGKWGRGSGQWVSGKGVPGNIAVTRRECLGLSGKGGRSV